MYRARRNGQGGVGVESMPDTYAPVAGDVMFTDPPTEAQIATAFPVEAAAAATAAASRFSQMAALNAAIISDPLYIAGIAATSAQIDAYINARFASLTAADRAVIAALAKIVFRRERMS